MTTARDHLSKADTVTIAAIEARVPTLVEARMLVERFQAMVRKKLVADLDPWIATARASLIASFASGIIKDKAAVCAAITEPWSNGQTEGQITKLKLVKRQMYGTSENRSPASPADRRHLTQADHHRDCVRALIACQFTPYLCAASQTSMEARAVLNIT